MQLKFSVLLNVYAKDNPVWLKQSLDSILNNTICPTEVIIVVDGSVNKDIQNILDQVIKNKVVSVLALPANIGRGAALAVAVPKCKYDLIALMDADDISRKDRFEKQLSSFASDPDLSVVGGQIQEVDAITLKPCSKRIVPLTHKEICKYLKTRMPFNNVSVMFKKEAILQAGNYKPFGMMEDYYMWARVIAKGYKTANLPDILADVRVNKDLYKRRGGFKYFCVNKQLFDEMRKLGLLSLKDYYYILFVRFIVQVLMPNWCRILFYEKVLR